MPSTPTVQPSVFDDPAREVIELPAEQQPPAERVSRQEMIDEFARLLGRSDLPVSEWRAVGDFEALDETVRSTCQWLNDATTYHQMPTSLPVVPTTTVVLNGVQQTVPAHGTRAVFDACMRGARGGLTPAQVQSSWNTAKRQVLRVTRGIGSLRGGTR